MGLATEPAVDLISDALQRVRLSGAVLFCVDLSAPWSLLTGGYPKLLPPASHMTAFHVVLEGECWVGVNEEAPHRLRAGDAVILPRAEVHSLSDQPGQASVLVADLLRDMPLPRLHKLRWGGSGPRTRMLCGFLGYEHAAFTPLYDSLPSLFCVRLGEGGSGPPLDALLRYAENEVVSRRPGLTGLRLRMAELLFVEALRRHMAALPQDEASWLAGVRDPLVGRAMAVLHESPQRDWTVTQLAQSVASSRSALAARFHALLGEPPMHYLARWRMLLAAGRLRDSRDSVESIAEAVGYRSSAAFQRAFKRRIGATPAQWRRDGEQSTG